MYHTCWCLTVVCDFILVFFFVLETQSWYEFGVGLTPATCGPRACLNSRRPSGCLPTRGLSPPQNCFSHQALLSPGESGQGLLLQERQGCGAFRACPHVSTEGASDTLHRGSSGWRTGIRISGFFSFPPLGAAVASGVSGALTAVGHSQRLPTSGWALAFSASCSFGLFCLFGHLGH